MMEDNNQDKRTDYEPNFIMKDPEPEAPKTEDRQAPEAEMPEAQTQAERPHTQTQPQGSSVWQHHASETPIAENTSFVNADTIPEDMFGGETGRDAGINVEEILGRDTRPEADSSFGTTADNGFGTTAGSDFGTADSSESEGLYRDPRDNFRPGTAGGTSGASARWSGGRARSESRSFFTQADREELKRKLKKTRKPEKTVTLTRKAIAGLIAACMAISCVFGIGGGYIGSHLDNDQHANIAATEMAETEDSTGEIATTGYNLQSATGSNMTIQEITKTAQKSVVEIRTEGMMSDSWMQQYVTEGAGSGVIISKDGYIMTNNHVIEGANKITVTTSDKHSYEATLVGADSTNDVAVLKIKATGLTPAVYGNSDQLQVGDMAVAIGNPLGELGGTVTAGIISATDRELSIDGKTMKLLQTDSSINPGNSGGGLFNGDGQLIGLVVAKSAGSDVEGLGFAIPINTAASVAQQLMDKGYVSGQPWTGMTYTEGSSGLDFLFGGESGGTVYIYSVDTKVAKQAGFKAGDVVYEIDGHEIKSIDDLTSVISAHKVGDKLKYTVVRDGETKELTITLQEKTKDMIQQQQEQEQEQQEQQQQPKTPWD